MGILAGQGYLHNALPSSQQYFAQTCSAFVGGISSATQAQAQALTPAVSVDTSSTTPRALVSTTTTAGPSTAPTQGLDSASNSLATAVAGLTAGSLASMVSGQKPIMVVTDNVRAALSYTLTTDLSDFSITPPLTNAELAYNVHPPKISIPGTAGSACDSGGGYAKMSSVGFGINPHSSSPGVSSGVKSSLLQFTSRPGVAYTVPSHSLVPAYYVSLPFNAPLTSFNATAIRRGKSPSNFTLPACSTYDGKSYVSCGHCNISSFTNHNVTFGCYDIRGLCPSPPSSSSRRRLTDQAADVDTEDYDLVDRSSRRKLKGSSGGAGGAANLHNGATDDFGGNGTTAATDDGILKEHAQPHLVQYAALLKSIGAEIANTLSINPFAFGLEKAVPILAFVGSLAGCLLLGTLLFLRVDSVERKMILKKRWHTSKGIQYEVSKKGQGSDEQLHILHHGKSGVKSLPATDNIATIVKKKPANKLISDDTPDDPRQPRINDDDHSAIHVHEFADRVLDQDDLLGGKMVSSSDDVGLGHTHPGLEETMFLSIRDR